MLQSIAALPREEQQYVLSQSMLHTMKHSRTAEELKSPDIDQALIGHVIDEISKEIHSDRREDISQRLYQYVSNLILEDVSQQEKLDIKRRMGAEGILDRSKYTVAFHNTLAKRNIAAYRLGLKQVERYLHTADDMEHFNPEEMGADKADNVISLHLKHLEDKENTWSLLFVSIRQGFQLRVGDMMVIDHTRSGIPRDLSPLAMFTAFFERYGLNITLHIGKRAVTKKLFLYEEFSFPPPVAGAQATDFELIRATALAKCEHDACTKFHQLVFVKRKRDEKSITMQTALMGAIGYEKYLRDVERYCDKKVLLSTFKDIRADDRIELFIG